MNRRSGLLVFLLLAFFFSSAKAFAEHGRPVFTLDPVNDHRIHFDLGDGGDPTPDNPKSCLWGYNPGTRKCRYRSAVPTPGPFSPLLNPTPATITVYVPADAIVTIDGEPTEATGPRRAYETAELTWPKKYQHVFKVTQGGSERQRVLSFTAGNHLHVDFRSDFAPLPPIDHSSPQKLFAAIVKADANNDQASVVAGMTPKDQIDYVTALAALRGYYQQYVELDLEDGWFHDRLADFDNILAHHGFDAKSRALISFDDERLTKFKEAWKQRQGGSLPETLQFSAQEISKFRQLAAVLVKDRPRFVRDVMDSYAAGFDGKHPDPKTVAEPLQFELVDLDMWADKASAYKVIKKAGKTVGEAPIGFLKIQGDWFWVVKAKFYTEDSKAAPSK